MNCPVCKHTECRRSRRRSYKDYALGMVGLRPWRCAGCQLRFYATAVSFSQFFYAHCGHCGSLELRGVPRESVVGLFSSVGRTLRLPALRCDPCRNNFFTIRPLRRPESESMTTAEP